MLTVGSLFSGIGGIDLGLERTGHFRTIWFSEIDKYANRVLAKHWPDVPNLGNVKEINFEQVERPDVIVGGYPCQPFSVAGKRGGEEDPRHLWPECLRALRILRPRYALFENVRGHLSLGFDRVLSDLASIGFNAEWQIISAASIGAPHRRDRLFIVAYPDSSNAPDGGECSNVSRQGAGGGNDRSGSGSDLRQECVGSSRENAGDVADSAGRRFQECETKPEAADDIGESGADVADTEGQFSDGQQNNARNSVERKTQQQFRNGSRAQFVAHADLRQIGGGNRGDATDRSEVFSRRDHIRRKASDASREWWEVEPDVGRVVDGIPARVDRLRALGNAVVPQIAETIGYLIADHANA